MNLIDKWEKRLSLHLPAETKKERQWRSAKGRDKYLARIEEEERNTTEHECPLCGSITREDNSN